MAWYWWVLVAVVLVGIVGAFVDRGKAASGGSDLNDIMAGPRTQRAEADNASRATSAFLLDMQIVADAAPGDPQSHQRLSESLRNFFRKPHVRTHVVAGYHRLALVQEMGGRESGAITREIVRTGTDSWSVRTRNAGSFDAAIREAEANDLADSRGGS